MRGQRGSPQTGGVWVGQGVGAGGTRGWGNETEEASKGKGGGFRAGGQTPNQSQCPLPTEPKPPKARQNQKEAGLSPEEPLPPTPPPETPEGAKDDEDPGENGGQPWHQGQFWGWGFPGGVAAA